MSTPSHRQFTAKRDIVSNPVYVSYLRTDGRNMQLERIYSRAVTRDQIHELVTTEEQAVPGEVVRNVAYVGFIEITQGGSLRVDDVLMVNGVKVGRLAGFDLNHYPDHLNIVVTCDRAVTGRDLGLGLHDELRFSV